MTPWLNWTQMAADQQMLQCGLELNVDKIIDAIIGQSFVNPENVTTNCTNSPLYPMGSLQSFSAFNAPQTMPFAPDPMNWSAYDPPTGDGPRLDQQPTYCQPAVHQPIQLDRMLDENGVNIDWNKLPPTREGRQDLKHPTPSDWEQWRPRITARYKHGTARMILKDMNFEGLYVTEKMLRERIRQWHLNTKNKSSVTRGKRQSPRSDRALQHRQETITKALVSLRPKEPVPTCVDDALQRHLLCSLHHYLDYAWESRLAKSLNDGVDRLLFDINGAIDLAAGIQSKVGWTILKQAETRLQQANWSRITPTGIVSLVHNFVDWHTEAGIPTYGDEIASRLRQLLKTCVSCIVGEQHPIVLMMESALCGTLDLETCCSFFAMADTKAKANGSSRDEREEISRRIRLAHVEVLWLTDQYAMIEDVLRSWAPSRTVDEYVKLMRLAVTKKCLGDYEEAERLYRACWEAPETVCRGFHRSAISGYASILMRQERPQEAVIVFLKGLLRYEERMDQLDSTERALDIDWLRMEAADMRDDFPDCEGLDLVIAKLDAISLATGV